MTFSKGVVLMAVLLLPTATTHGQQKVYEEFNRFCIEHFGAEKEELVYTFAGKELKFIDDGRWVYASERSAVVGFDTNLPAKTQIEYGPTPAYGTTTSAPERHFYVHLHRLRNLTPDTEYHYRLLAVDERGSRITSPDMTLRTKSMPVAVRVTDGLQGPPYILDKEGATYLVTRDLVVEGTAFDVQASGVTLDLGGHTVVYDNRKWGPVLDGKTGKPDGNFWGWINNAKYGVRMLKGTGLKVLNGTIRQGAGNDASQGNSIGFNPMYLKGGSGMEIAGLEIVYSGPQQIGIYNHWGGNNSEFHHNVFLDLGTEIINRHGAGSRAIIAYGSRDLTGIKVHHNLVKRTRQGGLSGDEIYHNEVCMDSWATNAFGISVSSGGKAWGNRVVGGGYHVCAFAWGSRITGHHNFVHLKADDFKEKRFDEYGQYASCNALRLTQYGGSKVPYEDNLYHDNLFVIHDSGGRQVRGVQIFSDPYVKNYVLRDSTVKVIADDEETTNAACVVTQGNQDRTPDMRPVFYRNCTFISNITNVKFGDDYGTGSNHHFESCRFVKVGNHAKYRTFWFGSGYPSKNHVLLDCTYEGGADPGSIQWLALKPDHDFSVAWTLTVRTAPGAQVTITDRSGKQVFSGAADDKGVVSVPLVQYVQKMSGRTETTPHTVTVKGRGARTVTLDSTKEVQF